MRKLILLPQKMTPLLRIRNTDREKLKSEHYLFIENPGLPALEDAILNPKAAGGVPLIGDVCLYPDRPIGKAGMPMMTIYSGIPERSAVILERDYRDVLVKTCDDRSDIFVLCPDHTPDTYHRIPYSAFIPRSEALDIATDFLRDGTVETDDSWIDFEQFYHDLLEHPVY